MNRKAAKIISKFDEPLDSEQALSPEMVYMTPNQILLNIDGHFLSIENLSTDSEGIFASLEEVMTAMEARTWICRGCGRRNSMEDRWCRRCGRSWARNND